MSKNRISNSTCHMTFYFKQYVSHGILLQTVRVTWHSTSNSTCHMAFYFKQYVSHGILLQTVRVTWHSTSNSTCHMTFYFKQYVSHGILLQTVRVTWHSTHFQVGGDNPKVEERNLSNLPQGLVEGHFPNDKYSKITQNSRNFHSYCLISIPNLSNLDFKR